MSALSEMLAPYPTSKDVAKLCDASILPISAIFCRLMFDRLPFVPNAMKNWADVVVMSGGL